MKRSQSFMMTILAFLVFLPLSEVKAVDQQSEPKSVFVFPAYLEWIEEEAFSGTTVGSLFFDERLLGIGRKAFDNISQLSDIFIPSSANDIASSAFGTADYVVIHGVGGSYAEDWAKENGIPFEPDYDRRFVWVSTDNGFQRRKRPMDSRSERVVAEVPGLIRHIHRTKIIDWNRRPEDRPELHPIDYRFP